MSHLCHQVADVHGGQEQNERILTPFNTECDVVE